MLADYPGCSISCSVVSLSVQERVADQGVGEDLTVRMAADRNPTYWR